MGQFKNLMSKSKTIIETVADNTELNESLDAFGEFNYVIGIAAGTASIIAGLAIGGAIEKALNKEEKIEERRKKKLWKQLKKGKITWTEYIKRI